MVKLCVYLCIIEYRFWIRIDFIPIRIRMQETSHFVDPIGTRCRLTNNDEENKYSKKIISKNHVPSKKLLAQVRFFNNISERIFAPWIRIHITSDHVGTHRPFWTHTSMLCHVCTVQPTAAPLCSVHGINSHNCLTQETQSSVHCTVPLCLPAAVLPVYCTVYIYIMSLDNCLLPLIVFDSKNIVYRCEPYSIVVA